MRKTFSSVGRFAGGNIQLIGDDPSYDCIREDMEYLDQIVRDAITEAFGIELEDVEDFAVEKFGGRDDIITYDGYVVLDLRLDSRGRYVVIVDSRKIVG